MDEKDKKQKTNWFLIATVIFALFAVILIINITYVATTMSQGTSSIVNADGIDEDDITENDGVYELNMINEAQLSQVIERHWIYGTEEHAPNQNGGEVEDSTIDGKVTDEYETNPSSEVKKNYHYVAVIVEEEENEYSDMATVDRESGKVNGELKPSVTYVDYYYSINDPDVTTTIEKSGLTSEGTKEVTEEGQSITYTISYEASVDDYIGNGTITIVDTLPYEISEGSYKVTVDGVDIDCVPTYDSESKTLTWVIDEVAIDTYGENDTTFPQTIKVEIELTVVYADVNYGAESITNEVSGEIVLEDFPDDPYDADPDDETIDLNITVEVKATKTWIDYSNSYNTRPGTITVNVMRYIDSQTETQAEAADTKEIEVTENNTFDITFKDLPKYDIYGNEYVYYITENSVDGYTTEIDEDFNIVNTIEQELTVVTGSKEWHSDETSEQIANDEATIILKRDGVEYARQTVKGNTSFEFTNLDVYDLTDGHKYTYTLEEENVPGYVTTFDEETNTFTNTMEATGDYTVTKVWIDGENAYNTRPNSINVTVLANGDETEYKATLNEDNSWTHTFENIELYDEDGHAITFTAVEDEVPIGYDVSYAATANGYQITNTISQEQIEISGTKTWIEPDGSTRKYAVFQLYQNGVAVENAYAIEQADGTYSFTGLDKYDLSTGLEWVYTVQEDYVDGYTTTVDDTGLNFTNTINEGSTYVYGTKTWITPEDKDTLTATIILYQDGIYYTETTVTGDGRYLFSELPQYSQTDGHEYVYTVGEIKVEGYTTTQDGNNFTNTIEQDKTSISGTKTWVTPLDDSNSLTAVIGLYRDDSEEPIQTIIVSGDDTFEFTNLDKYDLTDGHEYVYTVKEIDIEGYTTTQDGNNFTNTIEQDTTSVTVSKTWITPYDKSELTTTVVLYQDGEIYDSYELTGNNTHTFTDLPKYDVDPDAVNGDGHEFVYTTSEENITAGYHQTSDEDGNYINTIDQEQITISGQKIWLTEEDYSGYQATINLYRDDEEVPYQQCTVTGNGTYEFTVDKYDLEDGHIYEYTVEEERVDGFETIGPDEDGNFTNIRTDETEIEVTKSWVDYENKYGYRPDNITVYLVANGTATGDQAILSDENEWTKTFTELPTYDEQGQTIAYTVEEVSVDKYTTEIIATGTGYNIVNTIIEDEISQDFSLVKIDADGNKLEGVKFLITDEDGNEIYVTTDENGRINQELYHGVYKIQEVETIYGYNLNTNIIYIEVSEDGIYTISESEFNEKFNS